MAGKLIGSNFASRLLRILPWAEAQMGLLAPVDIPQPQILGQGGWLLVKLDADLDWDDSTGVSGVVWAGTPEVVTARTLEAIVAIPKITTSGTFLAGSFVLVERKDGRWKVTGAPCS